LAFTKTNLRLEISTTRKTSFPWDFAIDFSRFSNKCAPSVF
jgi:hypothetical protein